MHGIDFSETYAPTANAESIRLILALANRNGWPIHQADYKNAYLNAELEETIYMRQPPGFVKPGDEGLACRLQKAIYGLKQAGREWYKSLHQLFSDLGFTRSAYDHAVFFKNEDEENFIVAVHVDDLTLAASSDRAIVELKKQLGSRFEMVDLGPIHWLLGMKIERDKNKRTLSLSQTAYVQKLLERFHLKDAYPISIPLDPGAPLTDAQSPTNEDEKHDMATVPYKCLVGSLLYVARMTRPDVSFAVALLSRFMANPGRIHWEAAKKVLRYLKRTINTKLTYGARTDGLVGYTDADWASQDHRHSTSGYIFLIDGGAISWSSKKQLVIALSSTEAEFIASTHAAKELIWLRSLIGELARPLTHATTLFCDNQSAIALSRDGVYHSRLKHIDIRFHFIRDAVSQNIVSVTYCPTNEMVADMLTKALVCPKLESFSSNAGLLHAHA
jgi:hypothetical protein